MSDYHTNEASRAENAMLSHEVYRLTKELEEQKQKQIIDAMPDRYDPFGNPTEYQGFNGDYSKILPRITEPGYAIPLEPDHSERKKLRKYYNTAGWCMIIQFMASFLLGTVLIRLGGDIISLLNPSADTESINNYMRSSSMLASMNMLIYLIFNTSVAFFGMKLAKIRSVQLIRTKDFGFGRAAQYCLIGMLIWSLSVYCAMLLGDLFEDHGIEIYTDFSGYATSPLATAVDFVYSVVIAPITEELLFRGVMLRTLSKANQRFAIFASAAFFGLVHGNIPQFVLTFTLGIFLAHITMKHGSIIPAIIVHMFVNSLSMIISYVSELGTAATIISYIILIMGSMSGAILLLIFRGEDRLPATTPHQTRRGLYVAVSSVPFTASVVILLMEFIYDLLA